MTRNTSRLLRNLPALLLAPLLLGCGGRRAQKPRGDFREGDVLFQHFDTQLCDMIRDVTESQLTHCGLVVFRDGKPFVLEAKSPAVSYVPLDRWFTQGWKGYYAHYRPKGVSRRRIREVVKAAGALVGKTYDLQYQLSDEKIYCSELVYKGFLRGAKMEIGRPQKLGDLKWQTHEGFIRLLAGGGLPLERMIVTPVSVASSSHLNLIASTFPKAQ
jgi:hypothetical protein